MQWTYAILSSVACPTVQYFPHYLIHGSILKRRFTEYKMCVLIFSTQLSEIFFTLSRIERNMIETVYWSSCNVPFVISDFNKT